MIRSAVLALAFGLAAPAVAFERLGVVSVADPPAGPDADLAELTHQLRAACRDRIGGVEDVPTMRARLLGQTSNATLAELDRAYGGALAVYQNGEFDSALRTLHAIVEDLESLPETAEGYAQWVRAQLRLAHTALSLSHDAEADDALYALARTDLSIAPDPEQYSPSYRRRFDAVKARVRALPSRRLVVTSEGRPGAVFVNGRARGTTPLALWLPSGAYRIGGTADDLRVPSFKVDLRTEDRTVVLDFALAEALRVNAGPGLALPVAQRADGIVRAGAWLGVDKVVTVSRVFEGQAAFLLGSIYDVRRGALLREGSVRMVAGTVPAANLGALSAFLLTGQSSRDVKERMDVARAAAPVQKEAGVAAAAGIAVATAAATPTPAATSTPAPPPTPAATAATLAAPAAAATAKSAKPSKTASGAAPAGEPRTAPAATTASAAKSSSPPAPPSASPSASPAAAPASAPASASGPAAAPPTATAVAVAEKPSLAAAPPADPKPQVGVVEKQPGAASAHRWMRPAAWGTGAVALGLAVLSIQQGLAARSAYADADAMVGSDGALVPGSDPARYQALVDDGHAAKRNAYVSAGLAAAFAAAAAVLGWKSVERPDPALAFRF